MASPRVPVAFRADPAIVRLIDSYAEKRRIKRSAAIAEILMWSFGANSASLDILSESEMKFMRRDFAAKAHLVRAAVHSALKTYGDSA